MRELENRLDVFFRTENSQTLSVFRNRKTPTPPPPPPPIDDSTSEFEEDEIVAGSSEDEVRTGTDLLSEFNLVAFADFTLV